MVQCKASRNKPKGAGLTCKTKLKCSFIAELPNTLTNDVTRNLNRDRVSRQNTKPEDAGDCDKEQREMQTIYIHNVSVQRGNTRGTRLDII